MARRKQTVEAKGRGGFDVSSYLESAGPARRVVKYRRGEVIYSQGDPGDDIRYLQKGAVKLSVLSRIGKEAVVAMLVPGDFFGEGALAGQSVRIGSATAAFASSVLIIEKTRCCVCFMTSLRSPTAIAYMLTRNMRIEATSSIAVQPERKAAGANAAAARTLRPRQSQPHAAEDPAGNPGRNDGDLIA